MYKYSNGSYSKPIEYLLENNELVFTGFFQKKNANSGFQNILNQIIDLSKVVMS